MIRLRDEQHATHGTAGGTAATGGRKGAGSLEQEVFIGVQRTADRLMRDLEAVLKDAHLSATQYNVLKILRSAGMHGLACHEIGERMLTRDPDMTRLLDRLEDRELITRSRERTDRRVIRTRISPEGHRLLKELDEPVRAMHKRQLGHLGDKRLRLMVRLLEAARERAGLDSNHE
jgi:DNA-binding MarR family transcriptional regulator